MTGAKAKCTSRPDCPCDLCGGLPWRRRRKAAQKKTSRTKSPKAPRAAFRTGNAIATKALTTPNELSLLWQEGCGGAPSKDSYRE